MVENIRQQARDFYIKTLQNLVYIFMPPNNLYNYGAFAGGGLADIPREGYEDGKTVIR